MKFKRIRSAGLPLAALIFFCCGGLFARAHRPMADFDLQAIPGRILSESGIQVHAGKRGLIRDGAFHSDGTRDSFLAVWEKEMRESAPGFDGRELSGAFRIAFDTGFLGGEKESRQVSFGMFFCRLTPENQLELVFRTKPDDPLGPEFSIRSASRLAFDRFYDVAFSYSVNTRQVRLYLNGILEAEATPDFLPGLEVRTVDFGRNFRGRLAFLRLYDGILDADELTPRPVSAAERGAVRTRLENIVARHGNPHLAFWCETLMKQMDARAGTFGFTRAGWNDLLRQTGQAESLARLLEENAGKGRISDRIVTVFSVPATGGELLGPGDLPKTGINTDTLRIVAAKNEFESFSFLVFPFGKIRKFELVIPDLTGKNGARIPASAIDARLVKHRFRPGGAWTTGGPRDERRRVLVPDLLLHDENLLRVDETKRANELRFSYPDGEKYIDVSRARGPLENRIFDCENLPVRDADTLQSVRLDEPGRTQRFLLTVHVPKDAAEGVYSGEVQLLADGRNAGSLTLKLRVLPFELPPAGTPLDPEKELVRAVGLYPTGATPEPFRRDAGKRRQADLADLHFRQEAGRYSMSLGFPGPDELDELSSWARPARIAAGSANPAGYRKLLRASACRPEADGVLFQPFFFCGWNDFAVPGGGAAVPTRNGAMYSLAAEGLREGWDDLRYETLLRRLAAACRSGRETAEWLDGVHAGDYDPDIVRLDMIGRILGFHRQIAEKEARK